MNLSLFYPKIGDFGEKSSISRRKCPIFVKKETKSLILVSYFDKFSEFRSKLIKRDTFSKKSIEKERIIGQNGLILDKMKRN